MKVSPTGAPEWQKASIEGALSFVSKNREEKKEFELEGCIVDPEMLKLSLCKKCVLKENSTHR